MRANINRMVQGVGQVQVRIELTPERGGEDDPVLFSSIFTGIKEVVEQWVNNKEATSD